MSSIPIVPLGTEQFVRLRFISLDVPRRLVKPFSRFRTFFSIIPVPCFFLNSFPLCLLRTISKQCVTTLTTTSILSFLMVTVLFSLSPPLQVVTPTAAPAESNQIFTLSRTFHAAGKIDDEIKKKRRF